MNSDGPRGAKWLASMAWLSAILCCALAGGCGRRGAPADAAPQSGGVLTVGLAAEPDSLNLYLARTAESGLVANRVLPRLARELLPDEAHAGGFEPELASSWEDRDGGRTLVFHLRAGRWSDGADIECADLQFTLRAQTDPQLAWRGGSIKRHITAIECPDPHTALVRFDRLYPTRLMDANDAHLLPRSLASIPFADWRKVDWAARLPAGGPFRIGRVTPGQDIVLERNPGWSGAPDTPRLDRIVLRVVPDAGARMNQLLAGDLDIVDNLTPGNAARLAGDPNVRVVRRPGWNYSYLGWMTIDRDAYADYKKARQAQCAAQRLAECRDEAAAVARLARERPHPLFGDTRVRRAMTLAIDRAALVDALYRGEAEVPASPILAPLPEHDPQLAPLPCDPGQARGLLAAAGFSDSDGDGTLDRGGKPFVFELAVQAGNSARRDAAVMIQGQLAKVGVTARIVPVENTSFFASVAARKYDAWIAGWPASLRVDMTEMLHADSSTEMNFGAFNDPQADAVASQARDIVEDGPRAAAWRRWEAMFQELQPYTLLFRPRRLTGVRSRVHGVDTMLANDFLNGVENWWVAREAPAK